MPNDERRERPQPHPFHVYAAHAWEDKPFVEDLVAELKALGWRVWLDTQEIGVGRSLRMQLEEGLRSSRFGLVVLSPNFFKKQWTREELDVLFTLEGDGSTRILPVWLNVTKDEVARFSLMLAGRVGAISDGADAARVAQRLSESMMAVLDTAGSWAETIRVDLLVGMMWARPPQIFAYSLYQLDHFFVEFMQGRDKALPTSLTQSASYPSLPEFFDTVSAYDGHLVMLVGHQVGQQLLASQKYGEDGWRVNRYVIQLKTGFAEYGHHLMYVLLTELVAPGVPIAVPTCPPDHLAFIIGYPVARGALQVSNGEIYSGVYFVAARINYLPKVQ